MNKEKLYKRCLIVVVDRKKALFFTIYLGELEEYIAVFDKKIHVPQKVKGQEGDLGREDKILRHIQDHLRWHFQLIMHKLIEFIGKKKIHYVILGGHKEFLPKIKKYLPKDLKRKIKAQFITELNINQNEIIKKAKKTIEEINYF